MSDFRELLNTPRCPKCGTAHYALQPWILKYHETIDEWNIERMDVLCSRCGHRIGWGSPLPPGVL